MNSSDVAAGRRAQTTERNRFGKLLIFLCRFDVKLHNQVDERGGTFAKPAICFFGLRRLTMHFLNREILFDKFFLARTVEFTRKFGDLSEPIRYFRLSWGNRKLFKLQCLTCKRKNSLGAAFSQDQRQNTFVLE